LLSVKTASGAAAAAAATVQVSGASTVFGVFFYLRCCTDASKTDKIRRLKITFLYKLSRFLKLWSFSRYAHQSHVYNYRISLELTNVVEFKCYLLRWLHIAVIRYASVCFPSVRPSVRLRICL